jgi:hypothetical protein
MGRVRPAKQKRCVVPTYETRVLCLLSSAVNAGDLESM